VGNSFAALKKKEEVRHGGEERIAIKTQSGPGRDAYWRALPNSRPGPSRRRERNGKKRVRASASYLAGGCSISEWEALSEKTLFQLGDSKGKI